MRWEKSQQPFLVHHMDHWWETPLSLHTTKLAHTCNEVNLATWTCCWAMWSCHGMVLILNENAAHSAQWRTSPSKPTVLGLVVFEEQTTNAGYLLGTCSPIQHSDLPVSSFDRNHFLNITKRIDTGFTSARLRHFARCCDANKIETSIECQCRLQLHASRRHTLRSVSQGGGRNEICHFI